MSQVRVPSIRRTEESETHNLLKAGKRNMDFNLASQCNMVWYGHHGWIPRRGKAASSQWWCCWWWLLWWLGMTIQQQQHSWRSSSRNMQKQTIVELLLAMEIYSSEDESETVTQRTCSLAYASANRTETKWEPEENRIIMNHHHVEHNQSKYK